MDPMLLAAICGVIAVGALLRSALGFGDSLLGVPLLTLLLAPREAVVLSGAAALINGLAIGAGAWAEVDKSEVKRLLPAALVGVALGALLLRWVPPMPMQIALGVLLIAWGAWALAQRVLPHQETARWAPAFGLGSGILGGALTTSGPPLVLYAALRQWTPTTARATLQGVFLPMSVGITLSHAIAGLWTWTLLQGIGWALPGQLVALALGAWLNRRIPHRGFVRFLYLLLIGLGLLMVAKAF